MKEGVHDSMGSKRIECSCGGENPKCFRCGGLGYFEGEASEAGTASTGLHPRFRQAGGPEDSPHRKFDGRGARRIPDPVIDPVIEDRAKAMFQAAAAKKIEENERRRADAGAAAASGSGPNAATKGGGPSGRGSYLRMRVDSWDCLSMDGRQRWLQLARDEASAAARGDRTDQAMRSAPAAQTTSSSTGMDPSAPASNPAGAPRDSLTPGPVFPCPLCQRRFRELFWLDAHLANEHGRRAHAHYWENRFREAHGMDPLEAEELAEISEPPGRGGAGVPGGTGASSNDVGGAKADGGRDGSAGWHGSFRDQAGIRGGFGEFGSHPQFDAMDDESGA